MQEAILNKKDGHIELSKDFDFMCSQLANGRYKLKIERYSEKRTMPQNALMWMWFACIERKLPTS